MYSISFQEDSLLPRERLVAEGAEQLSNQELLSILIRTGNKKETVFQVSQRILSTISSLNELRNMTLQELQSISGIGRIKAIELQAMVELGQRISKAKLIMQEQILSKMQQELGHKKQEHLVALYLDTQNKIIHQQTIFIGSVSRSIAEPREILHYAVKHMATSIILVHNHPSGAVLPSKNDDEVTKHVREACELMGFILLDHLIVAEKDYYSYREETELI